jgi:hypothetical protein
MAHPTVILFDSSETLLELTTLEAELDEIRPVAACGSGVQVSASTQGHHAQPRERVPPSAAPVLHRSHGREAGAAAVPRGGGR